MELEVIKKVKVKVSPKTLFVYIPHCEDNVFHNLTWHDEPVKLNGIEYDSIEAIEQAYPELFNTNSRGEKCLVLTIDVETAQVVNWPKNSPYDLFDVKIVDEGEYILLDKNGEVLVSYAGYVPECVGPHGFGDYLEFEIDSVSNIPGWQFTQENFDELMKEYGNEFYEDM
jgi:hypothetical protein